MRCIVTAGPTYEPLDQVRRLTNFSTGRLGSELVNFLQARGHEVLLLVGQQATYRGERRARQVETFTTTANLRDRLRAHSGEEVGAVFHAAAVSDYSFGKTWRRIADGRLEEIRSGKLSTREGTLLAELVPTPKVISGLREWFPHAVLFGWKYEVEGSREGVIELAVRQIRECRTDGCVANGPGFGTGFGLVTPDGECQELENVAALFDALEAFILPKR